MPFKFDSVQLKSVSDDINTVKTLRTKNASTAAQTISNTTRAYIAGSNIQVAAGSLKAGTVLRWVIDVTKTAAGTASSTFDICFGTNGTTADTARVTFTKPAGTAVADCGQIKITAVVRAAGSAVVAGHFNMTHNLSATGFATIPCVDVQISSSAFDNSTVTNIGLCATLGSSDNYTFQLVTAECLL